MLLSMPLEHAPWEMWAERETQRWGAGHLLRGARGPLGESLGKRGLAPRKRPSFHQSPFRSSERDGRSPGGSRVPPCASANFPEINKPQASPSGAKQPGFAHSAGASGSRKPIPLSTHEPPPDTISPCQQTDEHWNPPPSWEPIAPRPPETGSCFLPEQIPPCYLQGPQKAACASFLPSLPTVLPTPPGSPLNIFSSAALWPRCGPGRSWEWCPGPRHQYSPVCWPRSSFGQTCHKQIPAPCGSAQHGGEASTARGGGPPQRSPTFRGVQPRRP